MGTEVGSEVGTADGAVKSREGSEVGTDTSVSDSVVGGYTTDSSSWENTAGSDGVLVQNWLCS